MTPEGAKLAREARHWNAKPVASADDLLHKISALDEGAYIQLVIGEKDYCVSNYGTAFYCVEMADDADETKKSFATAKECVESYKVDGKCLIDLWEKIRISSACWIYA